MDDRGSATLETALVIPVLVLLALTLCGAVSALTAQLRCVDAARLGARAAARGETDADVQAAVRSAAPRGARVTMTRTGGVVTVSVAAQVDGMPLVGGLTVQAEAVAADESEADMKAADA